MCSWYTTETETGGMPCVLVSVQIIQWTNHSVCSNHTLNRREKKKTYEEKRWKLIPTTMYCVVCSTWFEWQQETVKTIISIFNESLGMSVQENAYAPHLHTSFTICFCFAAEFVYSMGSSLSSSLSRLFWGSVSICFPFVYLHFGYFLLHSNCTT